MHPPDDGRLVTLDEFQAAAARIAGVAVRTPLLRFRPASDGVAFVKPECLQPTGSFKIRGAYNTLSQMSADERARGVVTHSSGNHAQAIARAARLLGIRALVVMPNNAPAVKVAGVRADGAEIEFVGPTNPERVARAHQIADHDGMVLVSSANHVGVIAGQGTIGLEIVAQLAEAGVADAPVVLVPVGLGGHAAGVSTAVKALRPDAHVFGVEPEIAADARDSLAAGELTPWPAEETAKTIADGLRAEAVAEIPFRHLLANLDGVVTVSEAEIGAAVAVGAREVHVVLEPSGAVTLAGLLNRRSDLPLGPVVAVLSGGNVDPERYLEFLRS
ncbi:MAG TPA: threonine/serine dehydratase [Candidatus Limnocylindria bacterium]|nr:threonine/serine dehydratase [Candidatus Limnocylindria bacterium]